MHRRTFLTSSSLAALGALSSRGNQESAPAGHHIPEPPIPERPNVIWILGDQLRAQALAFNGDPNSRMPNLDRAQVNGVNFKGNLSGFPLCCPFRGSMLTSLYPHNCVPGHEYPLPAGQKTVADVFNGNGYDTAYFGKWHLGGWHERNGRAAFFITDPNRRGGFKDWIGYENNNSQWDCWVHGGRGKDAFHYRLPGYETDELTNLLINYVKQKAGAAQDRKPQPFFAVLSVQPPHNPYVAPARFMANYNPQHIQFRPNVAHSKEVREKAAVELAGYYAMIENLDWNYGRVVEALAQTGQLENTHIFFFADHGDMHGSHGMYLKTNPYEESIRPPMILSGGQPQPSGVGWRVGRPPVLMNHVDIAPTTLGLCHIEKADWMVGTDLSHYRIPKRQSSPDPDSAYLQNVVPTGHPNSINTPYRGLVTKEGWKYVCFENRSWLMFNLNDDPYEESNLAYNNRYRLERKKLIGRLKQWVADTGDQFSIPSD